MTWQKIPYPAFKDMALPHLKANPDQQNSILRRIVVPSKASTHCFAFYPDKLPLAFAMTHGTEWVFCAQAHYYAEALCNAWQHKNIWPQTVMGQSADIRTITDMISKHTQAKTHLLLAANFYRLEELQPISMAAGEMRRATLEDADIYAALRSDFIREALNRDVPEDVAHAEAERVITDSYVMLWEHKSEIAGTAVFSYIGDMGINIAGVYTRPDYRGQRIASSLVAEIAALHHRPGCFVGLMADQKLAHTNGLYQKLGFVKRAEYENWKLTYPQPNN